MSACRDCLATIKWVRMEDTGRGVPVEPIADPEGTVAARTDTSNPYSPRLVGYVIAKDRPLREGYRTYRAHHGECDRVSTTPRRDHGPVSGSPPPSLFDGASS